LPEPDKNEVSSHSIWSGVITFGLVSVPVSLLPAQRSAGFSLRMLAPDGTPLRRRYYCSKDDRLLNADEIVRGYEIEKDRFVLITDEELEALAPKKSREIDLRIFVPIEQIDPAFFDRAYFLAPLGDTIKPYRLLSAAMEASGKAGIATFVMRGKEYLVAIISEKGLLRAETMRFADELRSPDDIGLGEPASAPEETLNAMAAQIHAAAAEDLDPEELTDPYTGKLHQLIRERIEKGEGVVGSTDSQIESDEDNVIDLMEILKRSVGLETTDREYRAADTYSDPILQSRQSLYEEARALGIPGRTQMGKEALAEAIAEAHAKKARR
jgi:DNA end-binding protein Ku